MNHAMPPGLRAALLGLLGLWACGGATGCAQQFTVARLTTAIDYARDAADFLEAEVPDPANRQANGEDIVETLRGLADQIVQLRADVAGANPIQFGLLETPINNLMGQLDTAMDKGYEIAVSETQSVDLAAYPEPPGWAGTWWVISSE
jgi:hypothetical protein